ncbi:unnamed protein product [Nippostrongylus brasiliensis]|uniref:Uncharacterized protein n=1 Tax=Nippostrongylus brasiliensis TaxID=27835 RepID=A0A0N4YN54_NIPBR|nr:unnamed protein product [Nippostrongylus brasiliensis]
MKNDVEDADGKEQSKVLIEGVAGMRSWLLLSVAKMKNRNGIIGIAKSDSYATCTPSLSLGVVTPPGAAHQTPRTPLSADSKPNTTSAEFSPVEDERMENGVSHVLNMNHLTYPFESERKRRMVTSLSHLFGTKCSVPVK